MKQLIAILCLWPLLAGGIDPAQLAGWTETVAAPSGFLVDEDFQEVDLPSSGLWTTNATVQWDSTVPDASEWARINDGTPGWARVTLGAEYSEVWIRFRVYFSVTDTSGRDFFWLHSAADAQQLKLDHRSADLFTVVHGASSSSPGLNNNFMNTETIAFVWVHYVAESGGGGNGVLDWYESSTSTRPATPSYSKTNGDGDAVQYASFGRETTGSATYVDDVTISETELGDFE